MFAPRCVCILTFFVVWAKGNDKASYNQSICCYCWLGLVSENGGKLGSM